MTTILDRAGWGAAPPKRTHPHPVTAAGGTVDTIVLHHSVTRDRPFVATLQAIQTGHLNHPTVPYIDVAYNGAAANQEPLAAILRGATLQGGATGSPYDARTLSICAIGDFHTVGKHTPTRTLVDNIAALIGSWIAAGHVSANFRIRPHSDYSRTACCGTRLKAVIPQIVTAVNTTTTPAPPASAPGLDAATRAYLDDARQFIAAAGQRIGKVLDR